jgi:hypothetical protein
MPKLRLVSFSLHNGFGSCLEKEMMNKDSTWMKNALSEEVFPTAKKEHHRSQTLSHFSLQMRLLGAN